MKKTFSIINKFLIALASLGGVLISLFFAKEDGYSHWSKRFLFFTNLSNIWIGLTCLILAILLVIKLKTGKDCVKNWWYILKYVFTVSTTITGLVFCFLLAPNVNGQYHPWSFYSLLTHIVTPVLTLVDFFLDEHPNKFNAKHALLSLLPLLAYLAFASVFSLLKIDFGRGDTFPYFFLNYYSPAGFFGFSDVKPFVMGSFYWIIIFLLLTLSISFTLIKLYNLRFKKEEQKNTK